MGEIEKREYKLNQYRNFNRIAIILGVFMIFLPVITYLIRLIFPNIIRCLYYEITLKPCPFCGFTTDLRNIIREYIFAYKYNWISLLFLLGAIIEVGFRINILQIDNNIKMGKIEIINTIAHMLLFAFILIYIISFFIFDLRRF